MFDVVLFLGVLYHMPHPFLSLEKIFNVTKLGGLAIIETNVDFLWEKRPDMAFYPGASCNNDPTNWCGPNDAAVIAMLYEAGFSRVETICLYPKIKFPRISRVSPAYRFYNALKRSITHRESFKKNFEEISIPCLRMVFHAWK